MSKVHTILPASGLATRMRGLPKFLLPCSLEYQTLLERHIEMALDHSDVVWIPTRPELAPLLESLKLPSDRVVVVSLSTKTMTETVSRTAKLSPAERFIVAMPDTFFFGENPWPSLAQSNSLLFTALWNIRTEQVGKLGQINLNGDSVLDCQDKNPLCNYPFIWGAMSFNRELLSLAQADFPHIGYIINPAINNGFEVGGKVMSGEYFDCGTPSEYLSMLLKIS